MRALPPMLLGATCLALCLAVAATAEVAPGRRPADPVASPAAAGTTAGAQGVATRRSPHLHLAASPILLSAPEVAAPLLSGVTATLRPAWTYTGTGKLAFAITQGPAGTTVDADSGAVQWTPPPALEGQQVPVTLAAADGTVTASVTFTVAVAGSTAVGTSVAGSTITVTQPGSLQGFALTLPAGATLPPGQVKVSTVSAGQAPPIPDGVTKLSDFFRVTPVNGGTGLLALTLPTASLPAGRKPEEVRLFVYSDAAGNVETGGEIECQAWIRTWYAFDVLPNGKVTIKLQGFGELAFIGLDAAPPAGAPPTPLGPTVGSVRVGARSVSIACTPYAFLNGLPALDIQACALTGDVTMTVIVKQFSQLKTNPAATRNELLGWLAAGRRASAGLGLASDPALEVVVELMPAKAPKALGFVTTAKLEDRRALHITNALKDKVMIQGTVVHEYFHHAQSRTKVAGATNLIDNTNHSGDWLIEGTARWFEDEVFDTLNTYQSPKLNHRPLPQMLANGLACPNLRQMGGGIIPWAYSYNRFAFWKMVESSCSGFSLPQILNCNAASDPSGIANVKSAIESQQWQCDFGAGFGDENKSTLASALLYYTYATQKENNIALLDGNEPFFPFTGPWGNQLLQSSASCTSFETCPAGSVYTGFLVPAGANAFQISAVDSLDPGEGAGVQVKSDNGQELWVWVGNAEQPGGLATGTWSTTDDSWGTLYAPSGRAPKTMVVLVNPDPTKGVDYKIRAGRSPNLYIYPDMANSRFAPVFAWGSPTADYTLVARSIVPLPAHYRMVWSFGDGTADESVDDDPEVSHVWDTVGTFTATVKVYEMPGNVLVAQASGPVFIKYFAGSFRLTEFTGSASGVIGDPYARWVLQFIPTLLQGPATGQFSLNEWSNGGREALLYVKPPGQEGDSWIVGFSEPGIPGAPDCPNLVAIQGASYSGRLDASSAGDSSGLCIASTATQVGTELQGTLSYWTKYWQCNAGTPGCTPTNQGQGSYTFKATYVPR